VLARLVRVFLAVTLLAAWQSALEHPIEHIGGHAHEPSSLCDTLAALTACAANADVPVGHFSSAYESPSHPPSVARAAEARLKRKFPSNAQETT
jgi:hypothetical protein